MIQKIISITNFSDISKFQQNDLVCVSGWIHHRRILKKIIFWKLRRNCNFVHLVVADQDIYELAKSLKPESVVKIIGVVKRKRLPRKDHLLTEQLEIYVQKLKILNRCNDLPFLVNSPINPTDNVAYEFRYLSLRRKRLHNLVIQRSKQLNFIRTFLQKKQLIEIETPCLTSPSCEGSNEFYIPYIRENIHNFNIYSLSQSPQIYKQLLINSDFDRYFQIARCFRNEDLRTNRQPEFTQLDIELAFTKFISICKLIESLLKKIFKLALNSRTDLIFERLTYDEAIFLYGTDKPDLRYDYKIINFIEKSTAKKQKKHLELGIVYDLFLSSQDIIKLKQICENNHLDSVWLISCNRKNVVNNITHLVAEKTITNNNYLFNTEKIVRTALKQIETQNVQKAVNIILYCGVECFKIYEKIGIIRSFLISISKKPADKKFCPVWITDFPLFKFENHSKFVKSMHHPFTQPKSINDLNEFESMKDVDYRHKIFKIRSTAFDLVINGEEIGGGSERIYNSKIQKKIFKLLGLPNKKVINTFNYLIKAQELGMPPSIGMAIGLDRLLTMINVDAKGIRDVIAFPKLKNGCDAVLTSSKYQQSFVKEITELQKILKYA